MGNNSSISSIKKVNQKRRQELIQFLLSNVIKDEELLKINAPKISNEIPSFPFISKIGYKKEVHYESHFILISNDIIIIPTKSIYKEKINILGKKETFNHSNFYFIKAFLIYLQKIIEKIHFLFSFYIT